MLVWVIVIDSDDDKRLIFDNSMHDSLLFDSNFDHKLKTGRAMRLRAMEAERVHREVQRVTEKDDREDKLYIFKASKKTKAYKLLRFRK